MYVVLYRPGSVLTGEIVTSVARIRVSLTIACFPKKE